MNIRILNILAFALLAVSGTAAAQDAGRKLHWRRIDVAAQLDQDGRLHVRERQTMVFSGDWNGGERIFDVRPGQHFEFHGITRSDGDGAARALVQGDLDAVDHFDFTDGSTLRWRSRLPQDPPFDNQEIVYELDYTLSNVLIPDGDGYQLDHDFGFPDRAGVIETFILDFVADDVWESASPLPLHLERTNLQPGASVFVTMPLRYTGEGAPAGVQRGAPWVVRVILALVLVGVVARMVRKFYAEETARGRFEPLTPVETIDAAWLNEHVFSMPPEVVGAIWDSTTSSPEVAAMIARMVMEGKLASRIETEGRKEVLHLELKVPRADLAVDERKLVNALFSDGKNTTDTDGIEKRYKTSGFDPAALISESIETKIKTILPGHHAPGGWRNVLVNAAVVLLVFAAGGLALMLSRGAIVVMAPIVVAVAGIASLIFAAVYRAAVVDTTQKARMMVVFLIMAAAPVLAVVIGVLEPRAMVALDVALVVMMLCVAFLVLRAARTREGPDRLALRRTLAAGRAFFERELKQPEPSLEDAWYPYLLAFGLGKHIDKWFRAFGTHARETSMASASTMAVASATSGGWSGGGPQFGGGGGFGGGGAGRTWATAVSGISAGVSAPSSSSSGGGGGGGGSSGGGGGGGW